MHEKPLNTHPSRLHIPRPAGVSTSRYRLRMGTQTWWTATGSNPEHADVGCVRGSGGAAQRCVGRLLVHVLPPPPGSHGGAQGVSAIASSSGVSSRPAVRTPRWYSTVMSRLPGPSSGRSQSYRTSTTARSGSRASPGCRTTGSRARPWTADTGAREWPRSQYGPRVALIAAEGGGLVEAYPHDLPEGKKTSASFLYNATRTMYERLGFSYERSKGKGNCVMSAVVPAATS